MTNDHLQSAVRKHEDGRLDTQRINGARKVEELAHQMAAIRHLVVSDIVWNLDEGICKSPSHRLDIYVGQRSATGYLREQDLLDFDSDHHHSFICRTLQRMLDSISA